MKSILQGPKEEKTQESEYPCLKISTSTGRVVLFTSKDTGTLVHEPPHSRPGGTMYGVGNYDTDWTVDDFEPLKGKIILSN